MPIAFFYAKTDGFFPSVLSFRSDFLLLFNGSQAFLIKGFQLLLGNVKATEKLIKRDYFNLFALGFHKIKKLIFSVAGIILALTVFKRGLNEYGTAVNA